MTQAQLQTLLFHLNVVLQQAPAAQIVAAGAVAETAKAAVEQALKEQPNQTLLQISTAGLKQAAQHLAAPLPAGVPVVERIAEVLIRLGA